MSTSTPIEPTLCFRRTAAILAGIPEAEDRYGKWLVQVPLEGPDQDIPTELDIPRHFGPPSHVVLGIKVQETGEAAYFTIEKWASPPYRARRAKTPTSKPDEPVAPDDSVAARPARAVEAKRHDHYCEAGKHYYSRERTRGRQPKNCPEHGGRSRKLERGEGTTTLPEPLVSAVAEVITPEDTTEPSKRTRKPRTGRKLTGPWATATKLIGQWPYPILYGPPGTGKTHTAIEVLKSQGHERVVNCYITPETSAAEIMGYSAPDETGTFVWRDGPVTAAMRNGWPLVINEIDDVAGDAETALVGALDDRGLTQYELMNGETIRPAAGFAVVATMNGKPEVLRPALADRFPYRFDIQEVHPDAIARLPVDLREAARRTTTPTAGKRRQSIRAWLAYAAAREAGLDQDEAATAVWQDSSADVMNVLRMIQHKGKGAA